MSDSVTVQRLRGEVATLRALIDRAEDDLTRFSTQCRLDDVLADLEKAEHDAPSLARVDLAFEGAPVIGTTGVEAGFLTRVLDAFVRAVEAQVTTLRQLVKGGGGVFPHLFVTDTIRGSFGFRLEELTQLRLDDHGPSDLALAVSRVATAVAEAPGRENWDEDLSAATMKALGSFFSTLSARGVTLKLSHDDTTTVLGPDEIRVASAILEHIDVTEADEWHAGTLTGAFREARTFEFSTTIGDDPQVMHGKISGELDYDERILPVLEQTSRALIRTTTRKRPTRTTRTYVLLDLMN